MHSDIATEVGCSFAQEFFELLVSQQYASVGRMFFIEPGVEHASQLTVCGAATHDVYRGPEIPDALSRLFAPIARRAVTIEQLTANQVSHGVLVVISMSSEFVCGSVHALLEHGDDEAFFVRDISVQLYDVPKQDSDATTTAAATTILPDTAVAHSAAQAMDDVAVTGVDAHGSTLTGAADAPVASSHAVDAAPPSAPSPASSGKASSGKAKKGSKQQRESATAAPVAPAEERSPGRRAPDHTVEEEEAQQHSAAVAAAAAHSTEVAAASAVEAVAPVAAPAAPAGPKSWASLARVAPGAQAVGVAPPTKVRPATPPLAQAAATSSAAASGDDATAAAAAAAKQRNAAVRESKAAPEPVGDRLMFNIAGEVSDDEIKAALGKLAGSVVSLRNQSKSNRVFVDFSVTSAFDALKEKKITVGSFKVEFQRQRQRQ